VTLISIIRLLNFAARWPQRRAERTWRWNIAGKRFLDGVAHDDPTALGARNAPLTRIRPRSTSVETISRFCVVTRVIAHVAGHLLALEDLARILTLTGRAVRRCEIDTPWVRARPPKLCRFIAPAKPLPIDVPDTSTNWPEQSGSAVNSAPTSIRLSGATRGTRPACASARHLPWQSAALSLRRVLHLGDRPAPSCTAV
jgi:hypothetical protein